MDQYLSLLRQTKVFGVRQKNRTGIDTFMIPGGMMQFDLSKGFPILTTKCVNFESIVAELIGFIRGYDSAAQFRELGTEIWDSNANENKQWLESSWRRGEDDLGRIYGVQWRRWRRSYADQECPLDQLEGALNLLIDDPTSRRNLVTAWNPSELDQMALPPCHLLYQFIVSQESNKLNMCMYQRSCDMFLGVPFNISSYALLLSLVAMCVRMNVGMLTMFLADVHIYENHMEQVEEQLGREPRELPMLLIRKYRADREIIPILWLENVTRDDISLLNYLPHPGIKGGMAI